MTDGIQSLHTEPLRCEIHCREVYNEMRVNWKTVWAYSRSSRLHVRMSKSMIFKVIEEQICIGVNKMDCETYGEISNEMKCMLFTVEGRALTLRFVMLSVRSLSRSTELYSAR